MIMGEEDL